MLENFERWARHRYRPKEASWKRPALFLMSLLTAVVCAALAYAQIKYSWTNDGLWLLLGLLGVVSISGLLVSVFAKDFWVALVMGSV